MKRSHVVLINHRIGGLMVGPRSRMHPLPNSVKILNYFKPQHQNLECRTMMSNKNDSVYN